MTTLGVIVGNRGFFPGHLCATGRRTVLAALEKQGISVVALPVESTRFGAVESLSDARKCAELFRTHRDRIDGVLVTLPNFGDERAVANALRWSGLEVPVLVHAFGDEVSRMTVAERRDSFCGKISVCANLRQYGIRYSLTSLHTMDPDSEPFARDMERFAATCNVVRRLARVRVGAIGARPAAFNTVRFSEKLLERSGITVETVDLSELVGRSVHMRDGDHQVQGKIAAISVYTDATRIPEESLVRMAKLGVVIEQWMRDNELDATAIQCWTALEEFYGVVPCGLMSMMSENLLPSACETDVCGAVGMLILQSASGKPAALLDWNNNYGTDPDKGVVFHCSNLPKSFLETHRMDCQQILAATIGKDSTHGAIVGRVSPGKFTFLRVSTDDFSARIRSYLGEGEFMADELDTFGGYGVVRVQGFEKLLRFITERGFEHHVAAARASVAEAVADALGTYLGWEVHRHHVS